MSTWIVLLRGINVGGRNILPMKELVRHLQAFDAEQVKTYIQSGNAVFRSASAIDAPTLATDLASAIGRSHGFTPRVLLLSADHLEHAIRANPFPEAEAAPNTLHLFFLASAPAAPDRAGLAAAKAPTERFHLRDDVFYLHAPEGIGRSKLAGRAEKLLGVGATARNWRTVQQLWALAQDA